MSARFEQLYEIPGNIYIEGAPIVVVGGALLKDTVSNKIVIQLKIQSISERVIKALKIHISIFDITKQALTDGIEHQYLDLSVENGQEFASNKAIIVPDLVARSFQIDNITVIFEDDKIWSSATVFSILPKSQKLQDTLQSGEMIKQYRLVTNDKAIYEPVENTGIWCCSCGTWNNGEVCLKCRLRKENVFSSYNRDFLQEAIAIRRTIEEETARVEKEKQEELVAKRKRYNKLIALICACLGLVFGIIMLIVLTKPARMVAKAERYIETGQYVRALDILGELEQSGKRQEVYDKVVGLANAEIEDAIDNSNFKLAVSLLKKYHMLDSCDEYFEKLWQKCPHEIITTETKDVTCTEKGYVRNTCTLCEHVDEVINQATGHAYIEQVRQKVTCTSDGEKISTCSICNYIKVEKLSATGHNWKSPTCTQKGKCTNCGTAGEAALGHSWNTSNTGSSVTCKRCDKVYTSSIKITFSGVPGTVLTCPGAQLSSASVSKQEVVGTVGGGMQTIVTIKVKGSYSTTYNTSGRASVKKDGLTITSFWFSPGNFTEEIRVPIDATSGTYNLSFF